MVYVTTMNLRTIKSNDYYMVSDCGCVYSKPRQPDPRKRRQGGIILKQQTGNKGYGYVALNRDGVSKGALVHRLVAEAFIGDISGMDVDHIDGNPLNNNASNLRIVTRLQNLHGFWKHTGGSKYRGVHKHGDKWCARIRFNYKRYSLGLHKTEELAAEAYNKKAIELGCFKESLNNVA